MSEKLIFDTEEGFLPANVQERSLSLAKPLIPPASKSELFAQLREPFPEDEIEWLPQPVTAEGTKQKCQFCESIGKNPWHKCPAIHVAFIGHASVTARLNAVDPQWTYRPFALDTDGVPLIRTQGDRLVLWIVLKVLDVEKIGVGDTWFYNDEGNPEKKLISDAIRNAAMRFGVGLELWKKDPSRPIHYVNEHGMGSGVQTSAPKPLTDASHADGVMVRVQNSAAFGCRACGFKTTGPNHNEQASAHAEKHKTTPATS